MKKNENWVIKKIFGNNYLFIFIFLNKNYPHISLITEKKYLLICGKKKIE